MLYGTNPRTLLVYRSRTLFLVKASHIWTHFTLSVIPCVTHEEHQLLLTREFFCSGQEWVSRTGLLPRTKARQRCNRLAFDFDEILDALH